jgi:hypothetical protein
MLPWLLGQSKSELNRHNIVKMFLFFKMSAIAIFSVLALAPWAKQEASMYIYSIKWQSINPNPHT